MRAADTPAASCFLLRVHRRAPEPTCSRFLQNAAGHPIRASPPSSRCAPRTEVSCKQKDSSGQPGSASFVSPQHVSERSFHSLDAAAAVGAFRTFVSRSPTKYMPSTTKNSPLLLFFCRVLFIYLSRTPAHGRRGSGDSVRRRHQTTPRRHRHRHRHRRRGTPRGKRRASPDRQGGRIAARDGGPGDSLVEPGRRRQRRARGRGGSIGAGEARREIPRAGDRSGENPRPRRQLSRESLPYVCM